MHFIASGYNNYWVYVKIQKNCFFFPKCPDRPWGLSDLLFNE